MVAGIGQGAGIGLARPDKERVRCHRLFKAMPQSEVLTHAAIFFQRPYRG
jgi:hypothetical protein